ncbi:MAG: hypothetical protein A2Y80_06840 [Deltaproteobacteria bacterium RBG_13_58_19]|nr:MAG: hypothetical protein A2Y80_06840 [Deltaproteobacteria bacterium RBG_13_58_19]
MEKWDKGIQILEEAIPVDQATLDRLRDFHRHQAMGIHLMETSHHLTKCGTKVLELIKDPITGAFSLPPDDKARVTE